MSKMNFLQNKSYKGTKRTKVFRTKVTKGTKRTKAFVYVVPL
jgi:hypothetical protein